ncbi:hypothetical protein BDR26DRAFT_455753 [Obelidium mucronatum]|nr:hypothetical protein BDR26DRAFT_455753 [Obelidium mucronatum]
MALLTPPSGVNLTPVCFTATFALNQEQTSCTRNVPSGLVQDSCLCKITQAESVYAFCSPATNDQSFWYPLYLSAVESREKSCAAANLPVPDSTVIAPPSNVKLTSTCYASIFSLGQIQISCTRNVPDDAAKNKCLCNITQLNSIYNACSQDGNEKEQWYSTYLGAVTSRATACAAANLPVPDGVTQVPPQNVNVTPLCYSAMFGLNQGLVSCTRNVPDGPVKNKCLCNTAQQEGVLNSCNFSVNDKTQWFSVYQDAVDMRAKACAAVGSSVATTQAATVASEKTTTALATTTTATATTSARVSNIVKSDAVEVVVSAFGLVSLMML